MALRCFLPDYGQCTQVPVVVVLWRLFLFAGVWVESWWDQLVSTTAGLGQHQRCPEESGCWCVSSLFCMCCVECVSTVCTVIKKRWTLEANQQMGEQGMGCKYTWNNCARAGDGSGLCVTLCPSALAHSEVFSGLNCLPSVIYSNSSPEEIESALLDRSHGGNHDFIITRVCTEVKHKDHINNSLWGVWHHRKDGFGRLLWAEKRKGVAGRGRLGGWGNDASLVSCLWAEWRKCCRADSSLEDLKPSRPRGWKSSSTEVEEKEDLSDIWHKKTSWRNRFFVICFSF